MRTIASLVIAGIIASAPVLAQGTPTASVTTAAPIYIQPVLPGG